MIDTIIIELKGTVIEFFQLLRDKPIRVIKWVVPAVMFALLSLVWNLQLHYATMAYVWNHPAPLPDWGHQLLGREEISTAVLDSLSQLSIVVFAIGTLWLRDLRLWVKVWTCSILLLLFKGSLDQITHLPDSIGWDQCKARLTDTGVEFFSSLRGLSDGEVFGKMVKMEIVGLNAGPKGNIWPVRFCADMLLSGHTATMFLFLLASCDLARRLTLLASSTTAFVIVCVLIAGTLIFAAVDIYLIIVNHFHYTVDCLIAIMLTLLLYTNAAVAIFTDWYAGLGETEEEITQEDHNGMIWVSPFCLPFCCFNGYYHVVEMNADEVLEKQQTNRSALFKRLQMLALGDATQSETQPLSGLPSSSTETWAVGKVPSADV